MKVQVATESENSLKRGKKLYVALFDYLVMFLFCVALFFGFLGVFHKSNTYKTLSQGISISEKELADACVNTKLTAYEEGENGTSLVSRERVARNYVIGQAYARFVANGDERANSSVFENVVIMNPENDAYYHYVTVYRISNEGEFSQQSETVNKEAYLKKIRETGYFDESEYPLLKIGAAESVFDFLNNPNASSQIFDEIQSAYSTLAEEAVADFMDNSTIYREKQQNYSEANEHLYKWYIYALLIVYFISMLVFYLAMPLILKEGRTIFMRLFKLTCVNNENQPIVWYQVLIRCACQIVFYLFTPLLLLLISMDISTFVVIIFVRYMRFFNLFAVGTLALVFTLCNMLFTFYRKKKKQTLAEFCAKIVTIQDNRTKTITIGAKTIEIQQDTL